MCTAAGWRLKSFLYTSSSQRHRDVRSRSCLSVSFPVDALINVNTNNDVVFEGREKADEVAAAVHKQIDETEHKGVTTEIREKV